MRILKVAIALSLLTACGGGGNVYYPTVDLGLDSGAKDLAGAGGDLSACAMPGKLCNGVCADLTSDNANCGNCGIACAMGQTCSGGNCNAQNLTGCHGFLLCQRNCTTEDCVTACLSMTTDNGQALASTLLMCLDQACPSMGGICDPMEMMQAACMTCYAMAQQANSTCSASSKACNEDMP